VVLFWVDLEPGAQVLADFLGSSLWTPTGDDLTRTINQELLEVPGDIGGFTFAWLVRPKPAVQRGGGVAIHLDLCEHGEVRVVLRRSEFKDLGIGARLLATELITGESEDVEALFAVLFLKRTQTCVLRREASSACDVDNQTDLVLELGEVHLVTGDRRHLEICECHSGTIAGLVDRGR
jgi:hypothetical protein